MSAALLDVADLEAGYGAVRVLHGLSLTVREGSITALIGGNGAGKTTLMKTLAGALGVASGRIRFSGTDITALSASKRVNAGLVLVPEGRLIFPQLTVEENLRLGAVVPRARAGYAAHREVIYDLFPRLAERRSQSGGTLSGGEQQMLALGRGLMAQPKLLLLDEPTLGLAPKIATALFETIASLRERGLTILIAEQDVPRTLGLADHGYVIENGRIVLDGSGDALLKNPRVREAYMGL